jgi:hypothetical protein
MDMNELRQVFREEFKIAIKPLEDRLTGVENRLIGVENRLTGVENRLTGVKISESDNEREDGECICRKRWSSSCCAKTRWDEPGM